MPLPQQVVEKLSREPVTTPGWSGGILFYAGALLGAVILIYLGLTLAYAPILRTQIDGTQKQIAALNQSISVSDEQKLATYYSQISNLRAIIKNHVFFSPFLAWLEQHTEVNVSFGNLSYSAGNQVAFSGTARSEADADQQVAIFQAAPEVQSVNISNLSFSPTDNSWQFTMALVMRPSVFAFQPTTNNP